MESSGIVSLDGKVAVVTGAGAGLGKAEALALARAGANVVINDISEEAVAEVAGEIEALGIKSASVVGDVSERATADGLVAAAVEEFGDLQIVVNNAGVLRDRMLFSMTDQEWDLVVRVHLRGHFLVSRAAAVYWRDQSKSAGQPSYGRLINTASEAFLFGSAGQPNYAAAKAGISALTVSSARALGRYGVRANAICPRARTGMTEHVFGDTHEGSGLDPLSTEHVAPFVAYLASPAADKISGQVFVVHGGMVALMAPPSVEQRFDASGDTWTAEDLNRCVGGYFDGRDEQRIFSSNELTSLP